MEIVHQFVGRAPLIASSIISAQSRNNSERVSGEIAVVCLKTSATWGSFANGPSRRNTVTAELK